MLAGCCQPNAEKTSEIPEDLSARGSGHLANRAGYCVSIARIPEARASARKCADAGLLRRTRLAGFFSLCGGSGGGILRRACSTRAVHAARGAAAYVLKVRGGCE